MNDPRRCLLLVAFLALGVTADRAPGQTYSRTYAEKGSTGSQFLDVAAAPGGDVAVLTYSFQAGVARLDPLGSVRWYRKLDLSFRPYALGVSPVTGDVLVVGFFSNGPGVPTAAAVLLDSAAGNPLWERVFQQNLSSAFYTGIGLADGSYLLGGELIYKGSQRDGWVVKVDGSGNVLWDRTIGDTFAANDDRVSDLVETAAGGYAVTVSWQFSAGDPDGLLLHLDAQGNEPNPFARLFLDTYGPDFDLQVDVLTSGDFVVALRSHLQSVYVARVGTDGTRQWEREYSTGGNQVVGVVATADGGCAVLSTMSNATPDYLLIRLDSAGTLLWQRTYGGARLDVAANLAATTDGGFVLAGSTDSFSATSPIEGWLLRLDGQGSISSRCPVERGVNAVSLTPVTRETGNAIQRSNSLADPVDQDLVDFPGSLLEGAQCATNAGPWSDLGSGMPGVFGVPCLAGLGPLQPGTFVTTILQGARPFSWSFLVLGFSDLNASLLGGTLVPAPDMVFPILIGLNGEVKLPYTWPSGLPSGFTLYLQYFIQDPTGPQGWAASNAVRAVTP